MSALITESRRSQRLWHKESHGDEVAEKLNSATPSPAVLRIRAIIERLKAVFEMAANLESACRQRGAIGGSVVSFLALSPFAEYNLDDPDLAAIADSIKETADEVSSLLSRYRWRPDIKVNMDGTLRQTIHWPQQLDDEGAWENATVDWLLSDLPKSPTGKGACSHFSRCERCGDWFYAGRDGAKFCKATCRVISHAQTEDGRAERALYMRQLRRKKGDLERKRARSPLRTLRTQPANGRKPKNQMSKMERI